MQPILFIVSALFFINIFYCFLIRHLGVVGVDVTLEQLETLMRHDTWGSVYAFLVDRDDGSTIIHPRLKPARQVRSDKIAESGEMLRC